MFEKDELTNYLKNNPEKIVKILELTDFHNISFHLSNNEIRCAYYERWKSNKCGCKA